MQRNAENYMRNADKCREMKRNVEKCRENQRNAEKYITVVCNMVQRWANSVLMTEYEYEYYSTFQKWPNTNTNIIRFEKGDRIRIRILFGLKKATEYEYEYYSVWKNRPNTNTNIICLEKITRIRIRILVFSLNYSNNIRIPNYSLTSSSPDPRPLYHRIV